MSRVLFTRRVLAAVCAAFLLLACAAVAVPRAAFAAQGDGAEGLWPQDVALSAQDDGRVVVDTVYVNNAKLDFIIGDTPYFTGTVPEDAPYTLGSVSPDSSSASSYEFWASNDGRMATSTSPGAVGPRVLTKFEEGANYSYGMIVWLKDPEAYRFTADTKLVLNGKEVKTSYSSDMMTMYYSYPVMNTEPSGRAIAFLGLAGIPEHGTWMRLWGNTALDTMTAVTREGWSTSVGPYSHIPMAFLATNGGFYDALAAAPAAGSMRAPLLLTRKNALPEQTRTELERLGVQHVVIMGGPNAISNDVESELQAMHLTTFRLAGDDAQLTAVDAATAVAGMSGSETCIVATSKSYHDALAIAPYAYSHAVPLYLTRSNGDLRDDVAAAIAEQGYTKAIVVGGEAAVTPATEQKLEAMGMEVTRLGGENALVTSSLIAEWCVQTQNMSANGVGVATAGGYHDALVGSALLGHRNSVLVLVNKSGTNLYAIDHFVTDHASEITHGYIFGGEAAVPASVEDALVNVVP